VLEYSALILGSSVTYQKCDLREITVFGVASSSVMSGLCHISWWIILRINFMNTITLPRQCGSSHQCDSYFTDSFHINLSRIIEHWS
jgi:hypothetical protein